MIAFTPPDGAWTLSALMLVTGNTCGVGYVKSTLVNRGPMPIGGSYRVTVADQSTFSVLGEFVTHCQIAAPNSSATCSDSRQSFVFPCRPISVLAVPMR